MQWRPRSSSAPMLQWGSAATGRTACICTETHVTCGLQVLHPVDAAQRSQHIKVSQKEARTLTGVRSVCPFTALSARVKETLGESNGSL